MDEYAQTKQVYEAQAEGLVVDWSMEPRLRHVRLALAMSFADKPRLLELGCGPGRDAAAALPLTSSYRVSTIPLS